LAVIVNLTFKEETALCSIKTQSVPRSKHLPQRLFKNQSPNVIQGKSHCLFTDPYTTHKSYVTTIYNY